MYVYGYELMCKCPYKPAMVIYGMILPKSRGNVHGLFLISYWCWCKGKKMEAKEELAVVMRRRNRNYFICDRNKIEIVPGD